MITEAMVERLREALASVPDPRSRFGRRHSLAAILILSVCGMLSGARSLYAIWQWGRAQDAATVQAMGFTQAQTPAVSSIHEVFRRLDVEAFEAAVAAWAQGCAGGGGAIAIDGKALRGIHGETLPGVHLVAAYGQSQEMVLAQKGGKGEQGAA